ncbi:hypothetical protein M0802_007146 [Mischocyttarus mexicanus]|nr:hypothetical protein M0802_007146 [Mischocyttarus mexicanus]
MENDRLRGKGKAWLYDESNSSSSSSSSSSSGGGGASKSIVVVVLVAVVQLVIVVVFEVRGYDCEGTLGQSKHHEERRSRKLLTIFLFWGETSKGDKFCYGTSKRLERYLMFATNNSKQHDDYDYDEVDDEVDDEEDDDDDDEEDDNDDDYDGG